MQVHQIHHLGTTREKGQMLAVKIKIGLLTLADKNMMKSTKGLDLLMAKFYSHVCTYISELSIFSETVSLSFSVAKKLLILQKRLLKQ